jgi:TRAP-type C4-dicarboxylate transport system permease small subunit
LALVLAAAALVLVVIHGTWQLALLTAGATVAIALTRMRYALPLALVLLAVVAVLAVTDRTAGGDERSSRAPSGGASQYAGINAARWLRAPAPFARTLVRLWVMR